ncbi:MAG TPA: hypothetical protein VKQ32_23735, partial [Polyangia bacterium]|nr:hypothetical protein [Polyangia bacterium]
IGQGYLQVAQLPQADDRTGLGRDRVLVLVDQALTAGDIDTAVADRELATADRELAGWHGEIDGSHAALVERRGWAQARLDAAARLAPH